MLSKPLRGRRINQRHWSAKGLVGAWLFNEGCGTKVFDSSGNGNMGTLYNMAAPSTATSGWGAGRKGTALRFDSINDYILCGNDSSLNPAGALAIEALVNPSSLAEAAIIDKSTWGSYGGGWNLSVKNGVLIMIIFDGAPPSPTYKTDNVVIVTDKWQHIVMTCADMSPVTTGSVKIYVDGAEKPGTESDYDTSMLSNNKQVTIGNYNEGIPSGNSFNGSIDYVKMYNRAPCAEEIGSLYRDEYAMFYSPFYPGIFYTPITARSYGYIF